ncbi:MAG: T9SS type A sorting domain-containing protein [candidate division WOR-3 bacterium]|nr:T9SS type A sorting domain-containing protein [candidate division WOR-3 bacterium]
MRGFKPRLRWEIHAGFRFYAYSTSADTWAELPDLPFEVSPGLALAAEPCGNRVFALAPSDSGTVLWEYSALSGTWTQRPSPPWVGDVGMSAAFAAGNVYALTGFEMTPGWFWCYDPSFELNLGRHLEGVAGASQPLLRWTCTCEPNPFVARTTIRWQVPKLCDVSLKVYNTAGQMVRLLRQGSVKPGIYTTTWNGCDGRGRHVAAGVYFCTLESGQKRINRKVVLTD